MSRNAEEGQSIRAAWLHYVGGMTQAEVATRLGIPGVKAHRLIARAQQSGAIKVRVEGDIVECVALENALCGLYSLTMCQVVPDLHETGLPLTALGAAGATFLHAEIDKASSTVIGIGNGRSLAAAVTAMSRISAKDVRFVSLLGGLTRNYAANPFDVMHRLAEKTGAEAYAMPAPFFANTPEDRAVILAQRGVREVLAMADSASLMVVGIGAADIEGQLVSSRIVSPDDMAHVVALGGVGEMLGHFFDAAGTIVETPLSARILSMPASALRDRRVVAIAGGEGKVAALRSVLKSGLLSGLITDETTARVLSIPPAMTDTTGDRRMARPSVMSSRPVEISP